MRHLIIRKINQTRTSFKLCCESRNIFIICLVVLILPTFTSNAFSNNKWTSVPLTSVKQSIHELPGGEGMQMVFGIAYAPSNPNIVYMVSDTSQVWKSTDGGNSWQMKHKGFNANGGMSIAVDPANENIAIVAGSMADKNNTISPADGIYQTLDGGESWGLVKQTPYFRGKEGTHFAFDRSSSVKGQTMVIYAGTHMDGLIKSMDGGTTWTYLGLKGIRIFDIKINPKNTLKLVIATQDGLYGTDDGGSNIKKMDVKGLLLTDLPITSIALDGSNPDIIYAAARKAGVYRSDDGGITFYASNNGLIPDLDYNQISVCNIDAKYAYVSVESYGGLAPFWSNDNGKVWYVPLTLDKDGLSLTTGRFSSAPIAIHPDDCKIALTSANGAARIMKTTDGGKTWSYSNNGYTGGRMGIGKASLAFSDDPLRMIFFLIDVGPALTIDGGNTFKLLDIPRIDGKTTPVGGILPKVKSTRPAPPTLLTIDGGKSPNLSDPLPDSGLLVTAIGGWGSQTLAISRDNGKNWNVIPDTEDNYRFIAFHPQKPDIIYAQGFISKNRGNSWKRGSGKVMGVFKSNGDIVYSIDKVGTYSSIIKRSNDMGETWAAPYPELPVRIESINEIDIDPLNSDRIYLASNSGFYILDGKKWIQKVEENGLIKDHFGLLSFKCVTVDPRHPEVVYTGRWAPGKGHSNGIFRSNDYGSTWENITYNLDQPFTVWSISVSPHNGIVYVGSSHGTWKLPPPY